MVKLRSHGEFIALRTISRQNKRKNYIYLEREQLMLLSDNREVTVKDGNNFAVFRRTDNGCLLYVTLYWLGESSNRKLVGLKEIFLLPYNRFRDFLFNNDDEESILSLEHDVFPRLVFKETKMLRRAVADKKYRKKLSRFLASAFQWPGATEIQLYDDMVPNSFLFKELRGNTVGITGGVMLHGQDDPTTAYYSVHT